MSSSKRPLGYTILGRLRSFQTQKANPAIMAAAATGPITAPATQAWLVFDGPVEAISAGVVGGMVEDEARAGVVGGMEEDEARAGVVGGMEEDEARAGVVEAVVLKELGKLVWLSMIMELKTWVEPRKLVEVAMLVEAAVLVEPPEVAAVTA
jgi:hypothetical protein